ncbi:PhoX family phosphatase [Hydrogenophaga sp.]|uniref:PhoX family protein n=1 Tax=Hydrogenophaga sp. TaxID=1904254 RepID=UPI0035691AB1
MNARIPTDLSSSLKAEEDSNHSDNPSFDTVLAARLSRRGLLRGGAGTVGTVVLGGMGLTACGGGDDPAPTTPPAPGTPTETLLGFGAVAKSLADMVVVPAGYTASVLYALGDPLNAGTAAYKNDGTDTGFENRAGDHHDGMEWFGLDAAGKASATATARGLLAMNHEATTDELRSSFFLHANGGTTTLPRPAAEVDKETAIHGVSIVEVQQAAGKWTTVQNSAFNHRLTCLSDNIQLNGPARGNALMVTKYSTTGVQTRGTLNNCGTGKTPWGSFVTGEENWAGYFTRASTDDTARGGATAKSVVSLKRYGRNAGSRSRHGWETGGADDKYARWNVGQSGASLDGSDDYRNELNTFGYIVEMDAYDKTQMPRKRTALGRFAHESAAFGKPVVGQPLAVYMGDDSRGEYIYKFVSTKTWVAADANPANRITTGDSYLDAGKLYVAKFASDGSGSWVELAMSNPLISGYATYAFADQADVLVNARLAADAVGATKMDRPEWCSTNVNNGEIYFTLTNNSNRAIDSASMPPDSANPRVYEDTKGASTSKGNVNGHILRVKEGAAGNAALVFTWDVYVFGAESGAAAGSVNLSSLTSDQDFSSPDGLAFSPSTGILWIQTDDGAYTDVTNCMMLAALPGTVGDGAKKTLSYTKADTTTLSVDTYVGQAPTADKLKRFLVGPKSCEITGMCETPDGKAMFINIQHPGETTAMADIADPTKYASQWPSNAGYGAGKRPRSATIVITKTDGGRIGS